MILVAGLASIAMASERSAIGSSFTSGVRTFGDVLIYVGLAAVIIGFVFMMVAKHLMSKVFTVEGVGKVVATQLNLMKLAGLAADFARVVENPSQEDIDKSKLQAYKYLKAMTRQDFGMSVESWFEHLTASAEKFRFTYPEGYVVMRRFLEESGYNLAWNEGIVG